MLLSGILPRHSLESASGGAKLAPDLTPSRAAICTYPPAEVLSAGEPSSLPNADMGVSHHPEHTLKTPPGLPGVDLERRSHSLQVSILESGYPGSGFAGSLVGVVAQL